MPLPPQAVSVEMINAHNKVGENFGVRKSIIVFLTKTCKRRAPLAAFQIIIGKKSYLSDGEIPCSYEGATLMTPTVDRNSS